MSRSRDLSGFGAATPSPPRTPTAEIPPPPTQVKSRRRSSAGRTKKTSTPAKNRTQRITLSLPTSLAQKLKTTTRRDSTYYLDVILNALVDHGDQLRSERGSARKVGGLSVAPPRRRRPPGRTQVPLNIGEEALAELDRAARDLGLNRSGFVVELLERAL